MDASCKNFASFPTPNKNVALESFHSKKKLFWLFSKWALKIWVVKFYWSAWVSHSEAGVLSPKVKAVLHCEPPRDATPSSLSLWLTMERKLALLPGASSCTPPRANRPRSCTVSQEISLAGAYHHPLPVVFPVAFDLLCFQISSKSKRKTRLEEKAVTKTSKGLFLDLWCEGLTGDLTCDCLCFGFFFQVHHTGNWYFQPQLHGSSLPKG